MHYQALNRTEKKKKKHWNPQPGYIGISNVHKFQ